MLAAAYPPHALRAKPHQADCVGKLAAGDLITHVNGVNIAKLNMAKVKGLVLAGDTVTFTVSVHGSCLAARDDEYQHTRAGAAGTACSAA